MGKAQGVSMKFQFDYENIRSDEITADLVVPIITDPPVDEKYLTVMKKRILEYNNHDHVKGGWGEPVCIVVAQSDKLELRIQPHHQKELSKNLMNTQLGLILNLSSIEPACDLEARVALRRAEEARLTEARDKADDRIALLKSLKDAK
jgi:hypothetical protein